MPDLARIRRIRLYLVEEFPDAKSRYRLHPVGFVVCEDQIEEALGALLKELYGGGVFREVNFENRDFEGWIPIEFDHETRIEIRDIIKKMTSHLTTARYYILVAANWKKYRWIVAEPAGFLYRDTAQPSEITP